MECVGSVWGVCGECVGSVWGVCGECEWSVWGVCGECVGCVSDDMGGVCREMVHRFVVWGLVLLGMCQFPSYH